jgi:hypothetical protein
MQRRGFKTFGAIGGSLYAVLAWTAVTGTWSGVDCGSYRGWTTVKKYDFLIGLFVLSARNIA